MEPPNEANEGEIARLAGALQERIGAWDHGSQGALPDATRQSLRELQRAIAKCLEEDRGVSEGHPPEEEPHRALDSLRARLHEFEEHHPDLVAIVDRVARSLSNVGF